MIKVTKSFSFCYGHRLRKQGGRCVNLHGHNARVDVTLKADNGKIPVLSGMVADFGLMKSKIGGWLDANWDHAMIVAHGDHALRALLNKLKDQRVYVLLQEPTAENMADCLFSDVLPVLLKNHLYKVSVDEVRFFETETSCAICSIH